MTAPIERPATADRMFLWIMERFAEKFHDHAVLKGGMAMRLIDSPRSTTDIDYVFVPYTSKNNIKRGIEAALEDLADARVEITLHSQMLRAEVRLDDAAVQIEANVAVECSSIAMSTGGFAQSLGRPASVVRIMSLDQALANKLAAWNERRLLRDLYDCYFFVARLDQRPDLEVLDRRLAHVQSRLPALKRTRRMTRTKLAHALRETASSLSDKSLHGELGGLLPEKEFAGLLPRMKSATVRLAEWLEAHDDMS